MGERGEGSWIGFDASWVKLPRNRRLFIVRPGTSRINSTKMVGRVGRPPHKKSSPALPTPPRTEGEGAAAGAALPDKRRNLMKTFCCCVRRPSAVVRGIRRVINQKIKNKTMRNRSKITIFKNVGIGLDE